jgi:Flp pilus assembly protein TadG
MLRKTQISRVRRRRSGGQALVEGVFTIIPTVALILAFVDLGLAIYNWNTLQNAVREGARYAITFQRNGTLGQTESIKQVVERYSLGLVHRTDSPQHIFVCYANPSAPNACIPAGGNVPGNIVEVSVRDVTYNRLAPLSGSYSSSVAPFFGNRSPVTFRVYSADILGGLPVGVTQVQE